jgi:hypothetical protein
LFAQLARALLHPLLEFGVEAAQRFGVLAPLQAAGDLVGDEGQQAGVAP